MADQWFAIYDADGVLISTGTVIADAETLAKKGYTAKALPADFRQGDGEWDQAKREFVPRVKNTDKLQREKAALQEQIVGIDAEIAKAARG